MKMKWLSILPILLLVYFIDENEEKVEENAIPTGILLDTLQNEVMLHFTDDKPDYYYSNIFTPVCNTGECLPVKINLYWDLDGNYERFDQPKGEILTKLDHVPFTEDDYALLQDILKDGSDPRLFGQVKHYKGSATEDMSNPAPAETRMLTKYEMVDGISGATLPELEERFVPGALYTTYTLWGLAHDKQQQMRSYTKEKLFVPKYHSYFLTHENSLYCDNLMYHLTQNSTEEYPWPRLCCSLLDTGDVSIQKVALNKFRWNDFEHAFVQRSLRGRFYQSENKEVKQLIANHWGSYGTSARNLEKLSGELEDHQDVIQELCWVFERNPLTEGTFNNLIEKHDKLNSKGQKCFKEMLLNKVELTKPQIKQVKKL